MKRIASFAFALVLMALAVGCATQPDISCKVDSDCLGAQACVTGTCADANAGEIASNVKYLEKEDGFTALKKEANRLVFQFAQPASEIGVQTGDIIVGTLDGGYLRRVLSVSAAGRQLTLETRKAGLDEAIVSDHFRLRVDTKDPEVYYQGGKFGQMVQPALLEKSLAGISIVDKPGLTVEIVDGKFSFDPKIEAQWNKSEVWFFFFLEGLVNLNMKVKATVTAEVDAKAEKVIWTSPEKKFVQMVGWLPVVMTVQARLRVGVDYNVNATGSITEGFDSSAFAKIGARYQSGSWSKIWGDDFTVTPMEPESTIEGKGLIKVWLRPEIEVLFYESAGPVLGLEGYLKLLATLLPPPPCWNLYWGIVADLNIKLGEWLEKGLEDVGIKPPGSALELYSTGDQFIMGTCKALVCKEGTEEIWTYDTEKEELVEMRDDCAALDPPETCEQINDVMAVCQAEEVVEDTNWRVTLRWAEKPEDLDLHVRTPDGSHIFFRDMCEGSRDEAPFVKIDVDHRSGYGPETVTLTKLQPGTYTFFVHNYSAQNEDDETTFAESGAKVIVYDDTNTEVHSFAVPSASGYFWQVFELDGASKTITSLQTVGGGDNPKDYTDRCDP